MTQLPLTETPLRVAVVGAGPSGFYTIQALLGQSQVPVAVDLFDRLLAPFGLVRYGVAPDHPKIKEVVRVFEKILADSRVRYFGGVEYGKDLHLDDLLAHYDQVVFAVGGQSDRRLDIPGEDLPNSFSSTAFVAWYSAHPDFIDLAPDLSVKAAAVIGIGNVAVDVVRILARDPDELASTDISDRALAALRSSRIETVYLLARRGPVQAKCSPAELKEIASLKGVDLRVRPEELVLDPASEQELASDREAQQNLALLRNLAERPPSSAGRSIELRFLVSPVAITGTDRVGGLRVERNRLVHEKGSLRAVGTGELEDLEVGLVVRAVGYRSLPLPGLPFDERKAIVPNESGRVLEPRSGAICPRLYVTGWVKRGPTGLIGSNKPDGHETAMLMLEDSRNGLGLAPARDPEAISRLLEERGVRYVDARAWRTLDLWERSRGAAEGRPRVKLIDRDAVWQVLDQAAAPGDS